MTVAFAGLPASSDHTYAISFHRLRSSVAALTPRRFGRLLLVAFATLVTIAFLLTATGHGPTFATAADRELRLHEKLVPNQDQEDNHEPLIPFPFSPMAASSGSSHNVTQVPWLAAVIMRIHVDRMIILRSMSWAGVMTAASHGTCVTL